MRVSFCCSIDQDVPYKYIIRVLWQAVEVESQIQELKALEASVKSKATALRSVQSPIASLPNRLAYDSSVIAARRLYDSDG